VERAIGTGKTLEEAQQAALEKLGVQAKEVEFEILSEPRKVLGFVTGEYKVAAILKPAASEATDSAQEAITEIIQRRADEAKGLSAPVEAAAEEQISSQEDEERAAPAVQPIQIETPEIPPQQIGIGQRAVEFVSEVTRLMGLTTDVVIVDQQPGEITIDIRGKGLGVLIGRHGATLDALQYLTAVVANKGYEQEGARIILDAEKYRERRKKMLVELALEHAQKAKETKQEVVIPDLKPYERRIIHLALRDDPDIETYSEGEGEERRLVISPKNV